MKLQTEQINDSCFKLLHRGWFAVQQWYPEDSLICRSRIPSKQNVKHVALVLGQVVETALRKLKAYRAVRKLLLGVERNQTPFR